MMQQIFWYITNSTARPTTSDRARRFRGPRAGRFAWMLLLCSELACRPSLPAVTTFPEDSDDFQSSPEEPTGLSEDQLPAQMLLPGDLLHLRILSAEPYEPLDLWVDSAGKLHIPFGGDVSVAGLELTEAETRVETAIHKYDRYARATLSVRTFGGHRVVVSGAVDKPGVFEAKPGSRIADIVASAGGTRILSAGTETIEASDIDGARIVRDGKTLPVSIKRALVGEPQHNVYVRPGDIIFIPWLIGRQIAVLGDVKTARNVPYHEGVRLTEVLAAAGGPSRTADTADIRIIRGPLSKPKVYRANLDDLIRGDTTDVVLAPGDVVFVTEHWFATVTDVINRLTPILATTAVYAAFAKTLVTKPE